jgi:membrane carboxypeptidase/penicillin-binding protein PbpC
MRAGPWCPAAIEEWVADEALAGDGDCTWHVPESDGVAVRWPIEYVGWARTEGVLDRIFRNTARPAAAVRTRRAASVPTAAQDVLRIVNPPDGAVYMIDPTLRREFQTLTLRAAATRSSDIEWHVDGRPVGQGGVDAQVDWPLAAGSHVVTARDARGREASAAILVR